MERLLYFKMHGISFFHKLVPIAQKRLLLAFIQFFLLARIAHSSFRLKDVFLPLEPPVVVMGDASYSMDIGTPISSILFLQRC
jgi:hypothetical protein